MSTDVRLTLVIDSAAARVPTLWAELRCNSLQQAREALRDREGIEGLGIKSIGSVPSSHGVRYAFADEIEGWARAVGTEAVVWTALPARYARRTGVAPTADEAVRYLAGLSGDQRIKAEEYVRRTPTQIRTTYRSRFERELGWTAHA